MTDLHPYLQQQLNGLLQQFPHINRLIVAFSGGLDSSVLLHACAALRGPRWTLEAIHVHHGLSPQADTWEQHCRRQCERLHVPLHCLRVDPAVMGAPAAAGTAKVPEAAAREARYECFASSLDGASVLLLAHHRDDQAETVVQRLLRGAGPAGLAGMPVSRRLGPGMLWRPLLDQPRAVLEVYARQSRLHWIDDASNADPRMDRNYLRHRVLPVIGERWPGWRESLALSARHGEEAAALSADLARLDIETVQSATPIPFTPPTYCLDCDRLQALPERRQRNLLRHWLLRETGRTTTARHVARVLSEVIPARRDARPEVPLGDYRIRRHRGTLVLCRHIPPVDESWSCSWAPRRDGEVLVIPGNGQLVARQGVSDGVVVSGALTVRMRRRGDRTRQDGRPGRALTRMLQEGGIPVWWRDRLPLVTDNDCVVWVAGLGPVGPAPPSDHTQWAFDWYPPV